MDNNFNNNIFQICRTCMKKITDTSFFYLDCTPAANTQLTIRQKLYTCMPELDLSIVLNAVICSQCVDNLVSAYEFKKNCLQSEMQINKYIQQVQHNGISLLEVVRFNQPDIRNLDILDVKMEDLEPAEDFKNEDLVYGTSVFNGVSKYTESTEPKYLLKLQKVDTEDVLFNTLDYNINYNLSATEENSHTCNSSIAQNCLSEVCERQNNFSKNLNKDNIEDVELTEDVKNEDLVCGTNVFNEANECTESAEPKYLLKLQKVETEDVLFNTFDDYNINHNLSAAEETSDSHNSNIAQNYLSETIEHYRNYSKYLNKTNAYYKCTKCEHKVDSKLKLILHLKQHTRKKFNHKEIIAKRRSRYHKNLFYYRCSLCNYLTKYKCLFDFHNRIHLTKKYYKHVFKLRNVHTKALHTNKVNNTNIMDNKKKCVNHNNYDNHSFNNQNKPENFMQYFSSCNSLKPNMRGHLVEKSFKCLICECKWKVKIVLFGYKSIKNEF